MKKNVLEQLELRGLAHIFNEKDFLTYKRKLCRNNPEGNRYYIALAVYDMFIVNAPVGV